MRRDSTQTGRPRRRSLHPLGGHEEKANQGFGNKRARFPLLPHITSKQRSLPTAALSSPAAKQDRGTKHHLRLLEPPAPLGATLGHLTGATCGQKSTQASSHLRHPTAPCKFVRHWLYPQQVTRGRVRVTCLCM